MTDLDRALEQLPIRHRRVLQLRLGSVDGTSRAREYVAQRFGSAPSRIAELEGEAISQLRKELGRRHPVVRRVIEGLSK